jgi:hypothetical protein
MQHIALSAVVDIRNYAQVKHYYWGFVTRKFTRSLHVELCMTLLVFQFQKHTITGTERKSGPELQSNEPGTKREAKGRIRR